MRPGATNIFLDANVLYSRTLRDWFCLIALNTGEDEIRLCWSEDVLVEWLYRMRREHPQLSDAQIGGWRRRLEESCPQGLITGYQVEPTMLAGDPHDAHVIAAATHGQVDYLVTVNIRDFAVHADSCEFEIYHPDDMLCLMADRRPDALREAVRLQGSSPFEWCICWV